MQVDVAIAGGGITGLAAAFEAVQRGHTVVLLEASPRLGGLIRTERTDGFVIEAGPDSVLAQKPAALELCAALGLGHRIITVNAPRTAFVLRDGALFPLPSPSVLGVPTTIAAIARYELLPRAARARLALEPFIPRRPAADESVASFFTRRFGAATVDLIAEPLLGGIHAGDVRQLSMRSLFPRFLEAEARGSVLRAFRPGPRAARRDGLFRALAGGMEELVDALERRLPPEAIVRGAAVDALARDAAGWQVRAGGRTMHARAVILAVPAYTAADLLAPHDAALAALCREVPYVSSASVALAWPRHAVRHPLAGSGFVVARRHNSLRMTACTWVSSKWAGRAPGGHVLLRGFVGGAHDPAAVDLEDDALAGIVTSELRGILGLSGSPQLVRVHRWRNAGAQHHVGPLARVAAIEGRLAALGGLHVAGSGFRAVGIPDCVADGRGAAVRAMAPWTHS